MQLVCFLHPVTAILPTFKFNFHVKSQPVEVSQGNMRYSACTTEDISCLETIIVGKHPNQPKLVAKIFRNASIITALNAQKDNQ